MTNYPAYDPANPGEPLDISGAILHALGMRRAPLASERSQEHAPRKRETPAPKPKRAGYVGVYRSRGRFVPQWEVDGRRKTGRTHATAEAAAWERAQALGLSEPEVR
jgi:hypothetical protein